MLEVLGRFSNIAVRILVRIALDSGKVDRMQRIPRWMGALVPYFFTIGTSRDTRFSRSNAVGILCVA